MPLGISKRCNPIQIQSGGNDVQLFVVTDWQLSQQFNSEDRPCDVLIVTN